MPISGKQNDRSDKRRRGDDFAALDPEWAEFVLCRRCGMHDDQHRRFSFACVVENVAAHVRKLSHLGFTKHPGVVEVIEKKKSTIADVFDFGPIEGQGIGGFDLFQKDRALRWPDERRPVGRMTRVVVDLELAKIGLVAGGHSA